MIKDAAETMELVTQKELAKILRISEKFLEKQRWRKKGIPYIKIGSKVFYDNQDIQVWLDKQKLSGKR